MEFWDAVMKPNPAPAPKPPAWKPGAKIAAIKALREITGCSLREAKDALEETLRRLQATESSTET
jgi:hypothetical protein